MKSDLDHARLLLSKAQTDLVGARRLLAAGGPYDTVAFLAQQAVEKLLKAYLASHSVVFPKTHVLEMLYDACGPLTTELEEFRGPSRTLAPYAVNVRYEDTPALGFGEAQELVELAASVARAVLKLRSDLGEPLNQDR